MKKPWFTVTLVKPKLYALAEFQHWEQVVSYLIIDETHAFLIDTGMGYHSMVSEVKKLTSLPITVLLTHTHWDHIGSVGEFERVCVFNHDFEVSALAKGFTATKIPELQDKSLFGQGYQPQNYLARGKNEPMLLQDQQVLAGDTFSIQVWHTPGHTPGSVCYYSPELACLFTGDTLYPGPLYAQLPESNVKDYTASINHLNKIVTKNTLVLPGHNAISADLNLLIETGQLFEQIETKKLTGQVVGEKVSILL